MNYDDSIVYPGQSGRAHMHTYFGNTGSNASSTSGSLLGSGNSTCGGTANRSSYWVPSVINGSSQAVIPIWNMIYYKSGYQGLTPSQISPTLPNGLKVIVGDARATSAQPGYGITWACANAGGAYTPKQTSIPSCSSGDTLKMDIQFPQCWDGINLDSADHKSHMAYGTGSGCPGTHPVALPAISYNIDFPVGPAGTTGWKLASDTYPGAGTTAPGGFSLHADLITAWDPAVSSQFLANCTRQNADCHVGLISDTQQIG